LLKVVKCLVFIGNQVAVEVIVYVRLRDLVEHDNGIGHFTTDCLRYSRIKTLVLFLVVSGVPLVLFTVSATFDHKHVVIVT